jgi:hypothetical protein
MKKKEILTLCVYIIISTLLFAVTGYIIDRDRPWEYIVGRAIFMGIGMGILFYYIDHRKSKKVNDTSA